MCKKVETYEGGLNPSTTKNPTQKWLEDWIASASMEEKSKTKQWLESWANGPKPCKTKEWMGNWVKDCSQETGENVSL